MTGDQALRELLEVSEDVVGAVLLGADGEPEAATVDDERAGAAAEVAAGMLAYAEALRTGVSPHRLEAATADGHVFLVREGKRTVVAATGEDPVAGLVLHDLRACLRKVGARSRSKAHASSL